MNSPKSENKMEFKVGDLVQIRWTGQLAIVLRVKEYGIVVVYVQDTMEEKEIYDFHLQPYE